MGMGHFEVWKCLFCFAVSGESTAVEILPLAEPDLLN